MSSLWLRLREWSVRARATVRGARSDEDLETELRLHLDLSEDAERSRSPERDARATASDRLGLAHAMETLRDQRTLPWVEDLRKDTSFLLRTIRREPGFAVVAVLTIALAIGANAAVLGVVDTLILRPPPIEHVDRLVSIQERNRQKIPFDVDATPGDFAEWRARSRSFHHLAAWRNWYFAFGEPQSGGAAPELLRGVSVSTNFFSMLGIEPSLGRNFRPEEERPGAGHTVIVSDGLWRRRFGSDRSVVGRTVTIGRELFTVIGVLPRDFQFLQPDLDIWMPLDLDGEVHDRQSHSVMVFGRLADGMSLERAQSEMDGIAAGMAAAYPDTNSGWSARVCRVYPTTEARAVQPALAVLSGAASLVLLIACANLANLLLARTVARHREVALRLALGATRSRLVRQILTESVVLAVAGGVAGMVVGHWGVRLLVPLLPHAGTNKGISGFRPFARALDPRMLLLSVAVGVLAGLAFGVIPAFQATRPEALRVSRAASVRLRPARILMVTQICVAVVLLTGAGLLIDGFVKLQNVDPGFKTDHVLTMQISLPSERYRNGEDVRGFYEEVLRRIATVPGVREASAMSYRPFLGMGSGTTVEIAGRSQSSSQDQSIVGYRLVMPGLIGVLRQPLVSGRDFTADDTATAAGAVLVNEAMARRFWPGENPLGRQIRPNFRHSKVPWELDAAPRWLTVVGIVRNIRGLAPSDGDQSQMYLSFLQFPFRSMFLVVRTTLPPLDLSPSIQEQIRSVDPDEPVADVRTMDAAVAESVPRFDAELLTVFALITVTLSAVGIYGLTAYAVNRREQEIGIRMALGAQGRDVLRAVGGDTVALSLGGAALALPISLGLSRALSGKLYGIAPACLPEYAAAAILSLFVVVVAVFVPARRALRLDPAATLRA